MSRNKNQKKWKSNKDRCDNRDFKGNGKYSRVNGYTDEPKVTASRDNDWTWYASNEQLLRDSASFSYNYPLGSPINWNSMRQDKNDLAVPGVMSFETSTCFGFTDDANDAINIASRNIYTYVRHANSGSSNYDAPDLMIYLMAMDSIYSTLAYLKRVYGIANVYSYTNRYLPQTLIRANHIDFEDLIANLSNYRGKINALVVKAGSLCVPDTMPIFKRHTWLYSGLYYDTPTDDKAQIYMHVPHGYWQAEYDSSAAPGVFLQYHPWWKQATGVSKPTTDYTITMGRALSVLTNMLDAILSSESFNIMSGDILKAYTAGSVVKLEQIPESYTVVPVYSEEVLDQIQNLTMMGYFADERDIAGYNTSLYEAVDTATQLPSGWLTSTPYFFIGDNFVGDTVFGGIETYYDNRMVNFTHGNVTPQDTMVATRLTNIANREFLPTQAKPVIRCDTLGCDVTHVGVIWQFAKVDGLYSLQHVDFVTSMYKQTATALDTQESVEKYLLWSLTEYARLGHQAGLLDTFYRHPFVRYGQYVSIDTESGSASGFAPAYGTIFDADYWAILTEDDLINMNRTALLSLFNIMQYGRA